jgi:hypothetical protein
MCVCKLFMNVYKIHQFEVSLNLSKRVLYFEAFIAQRWYFSTRISIPNYEFLTIERRGQNGPYIPTRANDYLVSEGTKVCG